MNNSTRLDINVRDFRAGQFNRLLLFNFWKMWKTPSKVFVEWNNIRFRYDTNQEAGAIKPLSRNQLRYFRIFFDFPVKINNRWRYLICFRMQYFPLLCSNAVILLTIYVFWLCCSQQQLVEPTYFLFTMKTHEKLITSMLVLVINFAVQ